MSNNGPPPQDEQERLRKINEHAERFRQLYTTKKHQWQEHYAAALHREQYSPLVIESRCNEIQNQIDEARKMVQYLKTGWSRLLQTEGTQRLIDQLFSADVVQLPPRINQINNKIMQLVAKKVEVTESARHYQALQAIMEQRAIRLAETTTAIDNCRASFTAIAKEAEMTILSKIETEYENVIQMFPDDMRHAMEANMPLDRKNALSRAKMLSPDYEGQKLVVLSETALTHALNVTQLLTTQNTENITIDVDAMIPMDDPRAIYCIGKIGDYAARNRVSTLVLDGGVITGALGIETLLFNLQQSTAVIKQLFFWGKSIDDGGCVHLGRFIAQNTTLSSLRLLNTNLTGPSFVSLSVGIQNSSTLHTIVILNRIMSDESLGHICKAIAASKSPVETVQIHADGFSGRSMEAVADMIKVKQTLQILSFYNMTEDADMQVDTYTKERMEMLAAAMVYNKSLRSLGLVKPHRLIGTSRFNMFQTIMINGYNIPKIAKHLMAEIHASMGDE